MKKALRILKISILPMVIAFLLCSCSNMPVLTEEIIKETILTHDEMLQKYNDFTINIEQQEVDKKYGQQKVWVSVKAEEQETRYEAEYLIDYFLSDEDEWICNDHRVDNYWKYSLVEEPYYTVFEYVTGLYGIFDMDENEYIVTPVFEHIGNFDENGIAPAKKDGYYGFIDYKGNTVIDYQYEEAAAFTNNCAIVKVGGQYGVINKKNQMIVKPMYEEIIVEKSYFKVKSGNKYGIYKHNGQQILSADYEEIIVLKDKIFAKTNNSKSELFNFSGNYLITEKDISKLTGHACDKVAKVWIAGEKVIGVHCQINIDFVANPTTDYIILLDMNLKPLSKRCYSSVSSFNKKGYAVGQLGKLIEKERPASLGKYYWRFEKKGWVVIDEKDGFVCDLPDIELGIADTWYADVNDYYASACGYTGTFARDYRYGIVNLKSKKLQEWSSVEMIDGTNCIIVSDLDTKLYGLFDGQDLKAECIYTSIVYDGTKFIMTRGNVEEEYYPQR